MNNFLSVLSAPWAIEPAKLLEIQAIYGARLRGDKLDLAAVEKRVGRSLANEPRSYTIRDGVALLPIDGVIAKRMNMLTQISGGTSTQIATQALQDAIADPGVHSIILTIDSPGGTVDGTQAMADAVYGARQQKQIVTLASGCICSAAYWIGSAAQAVYIADGTTLVGSIGVVTSHTDVSGAQAKEGLKTTEISAGKYKRIASSYSPLTPAGQQSIQDQVDYTYSLFVDAVAKHRNVSANVVLRDMADGRVFTGKQSIDAGLTDGIVTLDKLIGFLNKDRKANDSTPTAGASMTRQQIDQATKNYMAAHPGTDYVSAFKITQGDSLYGINATV